MKRVVEVSKSTGHTVSSNTKSRHVAKRARFERKDGEEEPNGEVEQTTHPQNRGNTQTTSPSSSQVRIEYWAAVSDTVVKPSRVG
jgi:hypothetical protein